MGNRRVDKNQTFFSILLGISKHMNCKNMDKKWLLKGPNLLGRSWISFLQICPKIHKQIFFPNPIPQQTWSESTIMLRPSQTCSFRMTKFMKSRAKMNFMKSKKINYSLIIAEKVRMNNIREIIGMSRNLILNKKIALRWVCLVQKHI